MATNAKPIPGKTLVSPQDHTLIMIDHQSQMAFATKSIDAVTLRNNAAMVAEAAAGFKVSTILTTVAEKTFSGPIFDEIKDAFPGAAVIDRTSMNTWEDGRVTDRVNQIGKKSARTGWSSPGCGPRSASSARPCPPSIRASRSMSSPTLAVTSPTRRTTAPWTGWCKRACGP